MIIHHTSSEASNELLADILAKQKIHFKTVKLMLLLCLLTVWLPAFYRVVHRHGTFVIKVLTRCGGLFSLV